MAQKRKGQLAKTLEWARHLRPFGKRRQWGRERATERREISKQKQESEEQGM